MVKIVSGPGGTGGDSFKAMKELSRLGLHCVELEFTHGVNMSNAKAKEVGAEAKKYGIDLSIHAPYYINLASPEAVKRAASKKRILESCERGHYLGARFVVFHAAYYMKLSEEECYEVVKEAIEDMQNFIKQKKWDIQLAPETTGKATQFGNIDELIRLSKETGCAVCIDFAHLLAREGEIDYDEVMKKIRQLPASKITAHFSGIEFTAKGEKRHLITQKKEIEALINALKKHNVSIRIINESPDPWGDALKTQKIIDELCNQ